MSTPHEHAHEYALKRLSTTEYDPVRQGMPGLATQHEWGGPCSGQWTARHSAQRDTAHGTAHVKAHVEHVATDTPPRRCGGRHNRISSTASGAERQPIARLASAPAPGKRIRSAYNRSYTRYTGRPLRTSVMETNRLIGA